MRTSFESTVVRDAAAPSVVPAASRARPLPRLVAMGLGWGRPAPDDGRPREGVVDRCGLCILCDASYIYVLGQGKAIQVYKEVVEPILKAARCTYDTTC